MEKVWKMLPAIISERQNALQSDQTQLITSGGVSGFSHKKTLRLEMSLNGEVNYKNCFKHKLESL